MIVCPACKRRVFTRCEILCMSLDGKAKCLACGALARLDQMSRCLLTGVLALLLWLLLLHGDIFYSGYLFVFSMSVIVIGWRLLCAVAFPLLSMEIVPAQTRFDRRQNMVMLATLIVTAIVIDGLLSYRSDADKKQPTAVNSSESVRSQ